MTRYVLICGALVANCYSAHAATIKVNDITIPQGRLTAQAVIDIRPDSPEERISGVGFFVFVDTDAPVIVTGDEFADSIFATHPHNYSYVDQGQRFTSILIGPPFDELSPDGRLAIVTLATGALEPGTYPLFVVDSSATVASSDGLLWRHLDLRTQPGLLRVTEPMLEPSTWVIAVVMVAMAWWRRCAVTAKTPTCSG